MADKENKAPAKTAPKSVTLLQGARIECVQNVGGEDRKYPVNLVARNYTIVETMDLEIDPVANKIRADKFEAIKDRLKIKG